MGALLCVCCVLLAYSILNPTDLPAEPTLWSGMWAWMRAVPRLVPQCRLNVRDTASALRDDQ